MIPADLAELRQCIAILARVGEGISTAFQGINDLMLVGARTIERANALLAKADELA